MHFTLGQHGFGPRGGGGRALATTPKGGGGIQRFTRRGKSPPSCPAGARSVSSGTYGTGAQTTAYRDCDMAAPRPVAAPAPPPPPPPPDISVQVAPQIATQVSPQISPVMTQMQASPGAGVVAAPQQVAPAEFVSKPALTPGFDPQAMREQIRREEQARVESERVTAEWQRLEEEKARRSEQYAAEEQRRQRETQMAAERYAQADAQRHAFMAEQEAARAQAEQEAAARQAAAAETAAQAAAAAPIAPMPMGPMIGAPLPAFEPAPGAPVEVSTDVREAGFPIPVLLIAAAVGVGALMLTQGKRRRKR